MYDNNHGFYQIYRSKVEIKNRGKQEEEEVGIWYVRGGGQVTEGWRPLSS